MPAFLLGVLGFGRSAFSGLIAWLSRRSLSEVAVILLVLALLIDHLALLASHRHSAKVEKQLYATTVQLAAERAAYAAAQAKAAVANKTQVAGTEAQYKRISTDEGQSYRSDLAALRAANQRLRSQASASAGDSGSAASSPDGAAGPGTDATRLQVPQTADVQAEDAAEIELRLMHLQNYVAGLLGVDPNAEPKP